jgi:hypothetical protein
VALLTFLDLVCTSDCPLEAQEFREAGQPIISAWQAWFALTEAS